MLEAGLVVRVIDARAAGAAPSFVTGPKKGKPRAYRTPRALDDIDSVGLHHLGPNIGTTPKPGQTVDERAVWRALRQPYHIFCQPGLVVLAWHPEVVTWHGHGLNRRSVGLVAAGNFPATEAERQTKHDSTLGFLEALATALDFVRSELPHVRLLLTHSQSACKPADPGEMIVRMATAAGLAMNPPLVPVPGFKTGAGSPWVPAWSLPLETI